MARLQPPQPPGRGRGH